ncbi:MAG: phosphoribosylglycinamide formyltransferase [Gammaproteobacteria bacterium]|nr:MAG: phosphoribosylglycinamide formyltransferase [Gammaproteobacteria bacterium]
MKHNIIVVISGDGSNLQAIIDKIHRTDYPAKITQIISNQKNAHGLQRAKNAKITTKYIKNDKLFEDNLQKIIDEDRPKLIVLAGFMRILNGDFVENNKGKIINIHPSLLPKYKGLNTHQRVINDKQKKHGATVHYVSNKLDSGKIISQVEIDILSGDTADTLKKRVLEQEHHLYPKTIQQLLEKL